VCLADAAVSSWVINPALLPGFSRNAVLTAPDWLMGEASPQKSKSCTTSRPCATPMQFYTDDNGLRWVGRGSRSAARDVLPINWMPRAGAANDAIMLRDLPAHRGGDRTGSWKYSRRFLTRQRTAFAPKAVLNWLLGQNREDFSSAGAGGIVRRHAGPSQLPARRCP